MDFFSIKISQRYLLQHVLAGLATLLCALLVSPNAFYYVAVAIGQAHFIGAFLYQFRAGKIRAGTVYAYLCVGLALAVVFLVADNYAALTLIAVGIFAAHHFSDEIRLFGSDFKGTDLLLSVLPAVSFSFVLLPTLYPRFFSVSLAQSAIALVILISIVGIFCTEKKFFSCYFTGASILIFASLCIFGKLSLSYCINSLALFHYVTWYLYQFGRAQNVESKVTSTIYIKEMSVILGATTGLIVLFLFFRTSLPQAVISVLGFLYAPLPFYAFSIIHIVSSAAINKRYYRNRVATLVLNKKENGQPFGRPSL